ncbi:type I restriction endonuclease subunit M [Halobellus sp. Atlit-38R]|uniref:type I restriction endonuclease subunit M n=1 Tax=Halobellus sp. Atlit-38R TaxID=2282131 RepID=UPI001F468BD2|nr:type I restriction endonuclease subunit M [Halobellus sp. Atlit-38R]
MADQRRDVDTAACARHLADSERLARYRSRLQDSLTDPPVADAFEAWQRYVRERHGDVFATLATADGDRSIGGDDRSTVGDDRPTGEVDQSLAEVSQRNDDVARDLFVETLAFDYLLTEILDAVERAFECTVTRSLASDAAIPFTPNFEAVHESISSHLDTGTADAGGDFETWASTFAREASSRDVALLHRECVSPLARRAFGRYDTPQGLAALAVDSAFDGGSPYDGTQTRDETPASDETPAHHETSIAADRPPADLPLVVDPGCGAGAFLAATATRYVDALVENPLNADGSHGTPIQAIFDAVRGFDVSPTAVRASRLALVLAVRPLLAAADGSPTVAPRVVLGDAVDATADDPPLDGRRADVLLANPPWLTWDSLPEGAKDRWRAGPFEEAGLELFDHTGADARLGYANDDLSVPYALTCLHRLLRDGGRAALVLKRDLLTGPAGARLRRPQVGQRSITYDRVHDFGSLSPFTDVDAGTALFSLRLSPDDGRSPFPTGEGIPTCRWTDAPATTSARYVDRSDGTSAFESLTRMWASFDRVETRLVPADPENPTSPWIRADAERSALGSSPYRIRHGVKDDAKAVYALDRQTIEKQELESEHVFPYLKSKHIVKYGLFGHDLQLVPQRQAGEDNERELKQEAPATYAYLDAHRERLTDRGSSWFDDGPFYSLFGLGSYTWSTYKVVWCRLGFKPHFTVVSTVSDPLVGEKPVIPGDHCMFVGTDDEDEAHYLCALLNSAPYQRCLRTISSGGKSSLSKSTVERLALPEWRSRPRQRQLAELSQRAHAIVPDHVDCSKRAYNRKTIPELQAVQTDIDRTAEQFLSVLDEHPSPEGERTGPTDGDDE